MKLFPVLLLALTASSLALAGCTQFAPSDIELISTAEAQAILESGSPLEYAADTDKRVRIDGEGSGMPGEMGMGDMEMDFVLQMDPVRNAGSFDMEVSVGFVTIDLGVAQRDSLVNIRFRDTVYVGRDEVAEDIFQEGIFGEADGDTAEDEEAFDALLSGNFDFLFSEYEGYEVEDVEDTTWEGRQAFRIVAHAAEAGEDYDGARGAEGSSAPSGDSSLRDGDGEPDAGAGDVDLEYVVDARTQRPYFIGSVTNIGEESIRFEATFSYGDDVDIDVTEDGTRFPFTLESDETQSQEGGRTIIEGVVSERHTEEVKLDEVEMRAVAWAGASDYESSYDDEDYGQSDYQSYESADETGYSSTSFESYESMGLEYEVLAQMRLDEGTLEAGDYSFAYRDNDGDGLVSAGDTYRLEAPGDAHVQVAFYDLWADAPAGDLMEMMPGFELVALLAAVGVLVLARKVKHK